MPVRPPNGQQDGLDSSFVYDTLGATDDNPSLVYNVNTTSWSKKTTECSMYLMYISQKPDSRYVPLCAVDWKSISSAVDPGPPFPALPHYVLEAAVSSTWAAAGFRDVTDPPNWKRIIQTGTKPH